MREGLVSRMPLNTSRVKAAVFPRGLKVVASSWAGLQGHPHLPDGWELRSELDLI